MALAWVNSLGQSLLCMGRVLASLIPSLLVESTMVRDRLIMRLVCCTSVSVILHRVGSHHGGPAVGRASWRRLLGRVRKAFETYCAHSIMTVGVTPLWRGGRPR
jgi:hypothetical protein